MSVSSPSEPADPAGQTQKPATSPLLLTLPQVRPSVNVS